MTTSLTVAQLDELEAAIARWDEGFDLSCDGDVLRELLALGREALMQEAARERELQEYLRKRGDALCECTCGHAVVLRGGAYREPSGFTHYNDQPCGPDILGDES